MNRSYNYAAEKFGMAVYILATDKSPIKGRLMEAFVELAILNVNDIPKALQDDFKWVMGVLTKNKPKTIRVIRQGKVLEESTGRSGATIPFLRIEKATEVAKRICDIEARLQNEYRGA
jgi:hypothetical protein